MARNDCDFMIDEFEKTVDNLGDCFETAFDEKKTKINVVGSIFKFGFSLTKLTFNAAGCAIKNTPKAVVAVASVKRELITAIEDEIRENEKQQKEEALDEKIKQLKLKR